MALGVTACLWRALDPETQLRGARVPPVQQKSPQQILEDTVSMQARTSNKPHLTGFLAVLWLVMGGRPALDPPIPHDCGQETPFPPHLSGTNSLLPLPGLSPSVLSPTNKRNWKTQRKLVSTAAMVSQSFTTLLFLRQKNCYSGFGGAARDV